MNKLRRTQPSTAHTTGVRGSGVLGAGARNGLRMAVTMPFRNPNGPDTICGAAGAAATATAAVLSALLAALTVNVCAAGSALDAVAAADDWATASTTPTECVDDDVDETVSGDDDVIATLTVAECVEFDPVLAVVDVVCSASGAGGALG